MAAARLFVTATVEEQWQTLAGPWLRAQAGAAWKNPRPTVILTPSRPEGFYLRNRLVAEGMSPTSVSASGRPAMRANSSSRKPCPKLESAPRARRNASSPAPARKISTDQTSPDNAAISSVVREPGAFLRAYDLLLGAGWNPAREGAEYGRELARDLQRVLEEIAALRRRPGQHRQLRRKISAQASELLIANLLVIGFNATHWPLWDLLQAVISASAESTVAHAAIRASSREDHRSALDQAPGKKSPKSEAVSPD